MRITELFIQKRVQNGKYIKQIQSVPFPQYQHCEGWTDSILNQGLIFSHRNTWYTAENFTEKLHSHDYYEVTIYIEGNVEYINENTLISASPVTVVWFKPGQMHTSRLISNSQYHRYLLYFSTDFFCIDDKKTPIIHFMEHAASGSLKLSATKAKELLDILKRIEEALESNKTYKELLVKALLVECFDLFNSSETIILKGVELEDSITEVKRYIDTHYVSIQSVNQIAEHFFYSREHLSRKFMQAFNISVAQYLSRKRVLEATRLLSTLGATNAAYAVGFHNYLTFINAFKKTMGCLPSEYKES